ncbi:ABC transporter ATP-binding protein [Thomasclavelia cocleata]|uniref:ATP-binding cassette, subfamily B n=1 Tax=Thomasclavelia cocleata TaxID=69824 RepID=A0A1I0GJ45_9FIRM|nr:ABC transporter ATP-binding protein [Thomasclavelia cocleata]MCR1961930.1 ABC transporter ATP-binding protein/permease [Thomasclavelia cocleata]NDO41550.1 ABC transporter ATP-binding protein [Thomasclavelia cocleata]PJN81326.1 ABC transporter ATP-binding protein [Thomasclavelia cocleata]SET70158.1 ATP-binding cassette, subfamily B [Thomasclavelia cocleata]
MKLLKYIKEYRFSAIIGFVFKIAEAALELMVPLVMADIIDIGIKTNDKNYILMKGLTLVGLAIAGYLFALVCQYYASVTSQGVGTKLREDMYHQINRYDHRNLDKLSAPTLVTRLVNDVVQIQLAIAMTIRLTSRAPFIMIGSLVLAFFISGPLASIFIIGAVILAVIMLAITVVSMPYFNNIQKKLDRISLIVRENLNGIRVIRAFASQNKEINKFKSQTKEQKDIQVKVGRIQALLNPFTYLIVNIAIVLIIYFGGREVNVGGLSQGEIIALVNYMNSILLALIVFANVLSIYNKAGASYTRIFKVLETEPKVKDLGKIETWHSSENCIEFRNVNFAYNQKNILHNLSFIIKKGETIGIIGGTGAGKSSLVNLINRFYDTVSGEILINDQPIKEYDLHSLREDIGFVPQYASLISGTIRENIQLGNQQASDEELMNALKIAQGKELVEDKIAGLDTIIEQGGKNLSGGQKQRLTIARALVKKPQILILDDSSSALDYGTDYQLRQELKKLDITKIIISQRTSSIEQADKIIVLYHGEIVGFDKHEQLMKDCQIYQEIYASQHSKDGDSHE